MPRNTEGGDVDFSGGFGGEAAPAADAPVAAGGWEAGGGEAGGGDDFASGGVPVAVGGW
jgi:hypothetical protein